MMVHNGLFPDHRCRKREPCVSTFLTDPSVSSQLAHSESGDEPVRSPERLTRTSGVGSQPCRDMTGAPEHGISCLE